MNKFIHSVVLAASAIALVACAKDPTFDTTKFQQQSLDAWMAKHVNVTDTVAWRQDNGMYVQILTPKQPLVDSLAPADTIVWVRVNYTGYTLQNNVYLTRFEDVAKWQGTYDTKTYYAPDFLYCGAKNTNMIEGQYFALKNEFTINGVKTKMVQGSRVRLYMPSNLAYGSYGTSNDQGYGGQYKLSGTVPTIEDLEIVEVVKNPQKREQKLVADYAKDKWGLTIADTLKSNFYLVRENGTSLGDTLTTDSLAKIYYVGYFLDGFVFDTNIDSVELRVRGSISTNSALSYTAEDDKESYIMAFYDAIPGMRYGQWGKMVFTSEYGYGATGYSAAIQSEYDDYNSYMSYLYNNLYYNTGYNNYNSYYYNNYYNYYNSYNTSSSSSTTEVITEIQPYTPLIFRFYVAHSS